MINEQHFLGFIGGFVVDGHRFGWFSQGWSCFLGGGSSLGWGREAVHLGR